MTGVRAGRFGYMALLCLLLWSQAAWVAGSDSAATFLKARFLPDSAQVGSMVELALAYRLPEGSQLPSEPQIKGLEGLAVAGIQKGSGEIRVRLLVDRLTEFKTAPLSLTYLNREGHTESLHADPVALTVLSNLGERPEEAQLKPIYGIIPTRSSLMEALPWVLVALTAFATALGIFLWVKRRGRGALPQARVPPHTLAEREIHELASQGLFEKGHVKEFYFRFSEILRRYLESLRGFPAAEYTTQEIALSIRVPQDRQILPLLQDADLVKFADLNPTPARKNDEVGQALAYIRETGAAFDRDKGNKGLSGQGIGPRWRRMMKREETGP